MSWTASGKQANGEALDEYHWPVSAWRLSGGEPEEADIRNRWGDDDSSRPIADVADNRQDVLMRSAFTSFTRPMLSAVALGLLATSCTNQAVKAEDRLVDGIELPSEEMLLREKIEINQGFGGEGFGEHFLSYELASNNSLIVTHTFRPEDKVIGTEVFVLDPDFAMKARKQLWRVRPDKLEGIETNVRPSGCLRRWDHDSPDLAVGFAASDAMYGVFDLPRPISCDTPAAKAARRMLHGVLASFPRSKVAETFIKQRAIE